MDGDMAGTDLLEAFGDGGVGELGAVTVAAEVSEVDVAEVSGNDFRGGIGGGMVAEVAVSTEDTLFGGPGAAGIFLEEFEVVVGFQDEDVGGANALDDEFGGVAEVSEEADIPGGGTEQEPDGVLGVVRNGEGIDRDIAEIEGAAGLKLSESEGDFAVALDGFGGEAVAVDGDAEFSGEGAEAHDVVRMLVGNEDTVEGFRCTADAGEALSDLAAAEPGIDEQARFGGFQVGAVASGTAAENRETS
jgi:hypothetical protein